MVAVLTFHPVAVYALDPVTTAINIINLEYGAAGLAAVGASAPIAGVAIAVTLGVCAGLTVDSKISQASSNAGMTKSQYVINKISNWCNERGEDITDFYSTIANNVKATSAGYFILNKVASDKLKQFFNWADTSGEMIESIDYNPDGMVSGTYYGNIVVRNRAGVGNYTYVTSSDVGWARVNYNNNRYSVLVPFTVVSGLTYYYINPGGSQSQTYGFDGYTNSSNIKFYYSYQGSTFSTFGTLDKASIYEFTSTKSSQDAAIKEYLDTLTSYNTTAGDYDALTIDDGWESVKSRVEADDGESVVVNPHVLENLVDTVPADGKTLDMDLGDYVDAIRKAFDKTLADTVPAVDTATGEAVVLPLEDVDIAESELSKTLTEDIPVDYPGAVDVVNPSLPVSPVDALPQVQFSLADYFPFCLPFDAYNLLNKLAADPVTPSWTITFTEPYTGAVGNLSGDLHDWDNVAATVRNMELIVFIIGLAVVTRNLFIRS